MRVAVYYSNRDVRLEELPAPVVGPGEILMKVMACGICGSDVLEWYRVKQAPRVLGHEATGVVVKLGEGVKGVEVGDRVFVSHHVPCGECRYCRRGHETACETLRTTNYEPGGFAEYVRVPKINVERGIYRLPAHMSFEEGTFIEPLGCAVRGQRLAGVERDDTVLVLGSGVSGLLHVQLSRIQGAKRIIATDLNEYRLKMAKRFGADEVVNAEEDVPSRVRELNRGRGADRVIICTGAPSAGEQALHCVDRGGTILFFAVPGPDVSLPFRVADFWRDEVTLRTSYGAAPRDLEEALALISRREVNVHDMITHRLPLQEVEAGFRLVAEAGESLKVIIEPQR